MNIAEKVEKILAIKKLKKRKIDLLVEMRERYAEIKRIDEKLTKLGVEIKKK